MTEQAISYIEQSGVIPYRIQEEKIEIVLITSLKKKLWIIPKGIIEHDMTPQESAAKEAWEEAGIIGEVLPTLMGSYNYNKWGGTCRMKVFLMQVENLESDWLEANQRNRKWFSIKEAIQQLREPELKRILENLPNTI
ncbi:MAG: NUDIX hydrolase [Moorea sp. SIO2B7]|nr:NUDIX hydrolase [Moorena sp. SIO2B7]